MILIVHFFILTDQWGDVVAHLIPLTDLLRDVNVIVCRCMCMFIVSHATVCFCMFLVGYPQMTEPVILPGRLAQIDLSCVDVP